MNNHAMALLLLVCWTGSNMAAPVTKEPQPSGLQIAVAPFLPPHTIVLNYQPMRVYLEQQLQEPVTFITAPDYQSFYERTQRRDYAFIITVANAAWLAHSETGYVPMLRPVTNTQPVLVVPNGSKLKHPRDLIGKTIALPDPLAVVAMQGLEMLRELEIQPDKDVTLLHTPNHSAAVNHVITGEVAAAIVSDRALLQMPATTQQSVQIIHNWEKGAVPGVIYLASPEQPPQRIAQVTRAILKFVNDTPEGIELIKKLGYGGLVPATTQDLGGLEPYGVKFKTVLNQKKTNK